MSHSWYANRHIIFIVALSIKLHHEESTLLSHTHQNYLDTKEKLAVFAEEAKKSPLLAVDTEFLRERSFFPQLCLLQFATSDRSVILDPLVGLDLSSLQELLIAPHITKIFHAGKQDLEIIYHNLSVIPLPLFDTQLAAELLGMPQQTSLRNLVREFIGVNLNKSDSFSNWSSRPLTESQIRYALDDVRYLPQVYTKMHELLERKGRLEWLEEDFAALANEERYIIQPERAWKRVKHSSSLTPQQLGVLKETAEVRERIAIKRNLPRKWIISDELLVEIARLAPRTQEELFHLRGAENQLGKQGAREMLSAVKRGSALKSSELPERKHPTFRTAACAAACDLMRTLVNQRARDNQVTSAMLANKDELLRLASGEREGLRILTGWRYTLVGAELLELLEGKLSLKLSGETVKATSGLP